MKAGSKSDDFLIYASPRKHIISSINQLVLQMSIILYIVWARSRSLRLFLNVSRRCAIAQNLNGKLSHPHDNGNECIESNLHGYSSIHYKLIRRNIDICTVNRDKKFWLNLVIWGKFYDVIHGWQADFRNVT
jgi:hypothetical protein